MRFLAIAFIFAAFPAFCAWLRIGHRQRLWAYLLVGLLPFTVEAWQLDAALIDYASWPGYAKGVVITLMDALALAVIATHRAPKGVLLILPWLILYLAAAALSMAFSNQPKTSFFYSFQLIRVIVLVVAVARIAPERDGLRWLCFGLAGGIAYQAVLTVLHKAEGALQATGTMHQNQLGMMINFAVLPLLALLLAGDSSKIVKLGILGAIAAIALGASRGAIGFSAIGVAILFALSLLRRATPHKWRILGLAAVALAAAAPVAYLSLENRFETQKTESGAGTERLAYIRAANAMWGDHPFGVGANMYVFTANTQGYSQRAGVAWGGTNLAAPVHNIYLLIGAETGWIGLVTFVGVLSAAVVMALRFAFVDRRDPAGDIVLGCGTAVFAAALHSRFEWILMLYATQYMLAINLGTIAGLVRLRAARPRRPARAGTDRVVLSPILADVASRPEPDAQR